MDLAAQTAVPPDGGKLAPGWEWARLHQRQAEASEIRGSATATATAAGAREAADYSSMLVRVLSQSVRKPLLPGIVFPAGVSLGGGWSLAQHASPASQPCPCPATVCPRSAHVTCSNIGALCPSLWPCKTKQK